MSAVWSDGIGHARARKAGTDLRTLKSKGLTRGRDMVDIPAGDAIAQKGPEGCSRGALIACNSAWSDIHEALKPLDFLKGLLKGMHTATLESCFLSVMMPQVRMCILQDLTDRECSGDRCHW